MHALLPFETDGAVGRNALKDIRALGCRPNLPMLDDNIGGRSWAKGGRQGQARGEHCVWDLRLRAEPNKLVDVLRYQPGALGARSVARYFRI